MAKLILSEALSRLRWAAGSKEGWSVTITAEQAEALLEVLDNRLFDMPYVMVTGDVKDVRTPYDQAADRES